MVYCIALHTHYKRPESVLVVIYAANGEILLLNRSDKLGFWQSVTGSLLVQETPWKGAWRELQEETGFSAQQGSLYDCRTAVWFEIYPCWRHRYSPGVTQNLEHIFLFMLPCPRAPSLSQEHVEYQWVARAEAVEKVSADSNREAIRQFVRV